MKKFLVPGLLMLFVAGLGQQESKAGSFSIGISIGDHHRHAPPPVVVVRPPVVVARPPVVVVPPRHGGYYVRECEHRHYVGCAHHSHSHGRGYYNQGRHDYDRYDNRHGGAGYGHGYGRR